MRIRYHACGGLEDATSTRSSLDAPSRRDERHREIL